MYPVKQLKTEPVTATIRKEKRPGRIRLWVLGGLLMTAVILGCLPSMRPRTATSCEEATPSPTPTVASTLQPEPLTARQTRENAYQKDLATLRELSVDESIQEETRQQAARQIERMVQQHQTELGLEELLSNAGFAPCMVLIQNDALTVAVSASEITAADSAVVLSICLAHTEIAAENIRIMTGGV